MSELSNRINKQGVHAALRRPVVIFILIPSLLFCIYQGLWASERYVSQAQLIVKEPDSSATLDTSFALLAGFGVNSGNSDTELVKAYIHSNDMLQHLEAELGLSAHYSDWSYDFFSRLESDAPRETLLDYFKQHVSVNVDEKSQVVSVSVQAFEPTVAHAIAQMIVDRAEWYINEIGHKLAKEQLAFVQREHALIDEKLKEAKSDLLAFQRRHNLLNPEAEGIALQEITYRLEAEIAAKRTQLRSLLTSMSNDAPLVMQARSELDSLLIQLNNERDRLTKQASSDASLPDDERNLSVSQVLAKFSEYKIDMELALNAYTSSQVSLEKSRIEAYRQIKYLVTVESPTMPEEAAYPKRFYNSALFLVLNLLLFGIARVLIATLSELRH